MSLSPPISKVDFIKEILAQIHWRMNKHLPAKLIYMPLPTTLYIELTNACDHRCPLCIGQVNRRAKGFMDFKNYKILVDEVKGHVKEIVFSGNGEPALHPKVYDMI